MSEELQDFSLADLADIDVSDIQEIRFESLPAGIFDFETVEAELGEGTNKDNEKRYWAEFKFKVLEAVAVTEKGVDKESVVGKTHTEKLWIVPEKAQDGIGRIRAWLADMGCENAGKLGDVVLNSKGHQFRAKIVKQKDKNDPSISYARLKLESAKK